MKVFKTALVLTLVGLICGAIIGLANYITAPIIKKNAENRAKAAYKSFFNSLDNIQEIPLKDGMVYVMVEIKEGDTILGYVIKAKGTNQRGLIDLAVAYTTSKEVVGIKILESENTAGFYDQYIDSKNNTLHGLHQDDGLRVDNISGVTQSGKLINDLLKDIAKVAEEKITTQVPVDPYKELFASKESVEEDTEFSKTEAVTKKEIVKDAEGNVLGHVYTIVDSTSKDLEDKYKEIPYTGEGILEYLVALDPTNKVVGIYKIRNNHTGSYFGNYSDILEGLNGQDASTITIDTVTDATISGNALTRIFEALKAVL